MEETEFDKFADEYRSTHARSIRASGEAPDFFAEYKIRDVSRAVVKADTETILDFGGGVGASVPYFHRYFPASELTCIDVSHRSLDVARDRFPGLANFVHFDGKTIPFPNNSFDLVFAACVFHHIDPGEHQSLIREMHRVLRPGGNIFIFEHNPLNPLTVRAVNSCPFDKNASLIRAKNLKKHIARAGFQAANVRFRIFFPGALSFLRWLERYMTWLPLGAQYFARGYKANI